MLFAASIDPKLKIKHPVVLRFEKASNGVVVAVADDISEFGYGGDSGEARDDFGKSIAELYWSLKSSRASLSEPLANELGILERHIQERA